MLNPRPQTPEQRREYVILSALIIADFLIVMGLCWWGKSLYKKDELGPFLAVMLPTCVFALATALPLTLRWRRLVAEMRESQSSN